MPSVGHAAILAPALIMRDGYPFSRDGSLLE